MVVFGDATFIGSKPPDPGKPKVVVPAAVLEVAKIFCGCGNPALVWKLIREYLRQVKNRSRYHHTLTNKPYVAYAGKTPAHRTGHDWLLAYVIGHCKLTEHGGNISGCWPTAAGEEVLAFLDKYGCRWQDGKRARFVEADGYPLSSL